MSDERRRRVRSLFDRASLLDPLDRSPFLERECADDEELRTEVEELLRYDQPTAQLRVPPIFDRLEDEKPPARIGPYVLGERIGEGGFGEVYRARQTAPFERDVALKILKAGLVTHELLARFEAERQALALLDHPGIAKIHDAGTTERGRPYFVMELVNGESITAHCDHARLGIAERLELFVAVCEAVQHAHRRGIIHRDIKPSNVLVARTDAGALTKVIDFGVAKAGGHALSRETLLTEQGQLIGTPEYMSPEQADLGGLDVDTRTDVYALGVLLYELLAGSLPFDPDRLRSGSFTEALRIIREEDPPRPSAKVRLATSQGRDVAGPRRTSARRLEQAISRELDWIVLRALEKDRERRYESARALAQDVERFRTHQPVEAGPPSAAYRMAKFARRHRVALVVVAALSVAVVVSAVESNRRRVVAEEAREESEAVSGFLARTLGASDPLKDGRDVTVVSLLERAVASDLAEFEDQPLVRARLLHTIGEVYTRLGLSQEAQALLEQGLELRSTRLGEGHRLVAETHNMLGILFGDTGDYERSMQHYESALEIYRAEYGEENSMVAQTLNNIGVILRKLGKYDQALKTYEEALAVRERTLGSEHPKVAHTLANLGGLHQTTGDGEAALPLFERALAILEAHHGPDHAQLAGVLNNMGSLLDLMGEKERGGEMLRRALAIREVSLGPDHPDVGITLINLADLTREIEGPEAARPMYERTLTIWESRLGPDHSLTETAYFKLGILNGEEGDYLAAAPLLERALTAREKRYGLEHLKLTGPLYYLGLTQRELGELEHAHELLERSLAIGEAHGVDDMDIAATLEALMLVARDRGRSEEKTAYEARMQAILDAEGQER